MSTGYAVHGEAIEALALGSGPEAGNVVGSLDHVPGSVLRGTLAAAWMREHGDPRADPGFADLFERSIGFGPLRPRGATVAPLAALRCKYQPRERCAAIGHDLLDHLGGGGPPGECDECHGPLEPAKGEQFMPLGSAPIIVDRTRTRLDADERAAPGELFTRQALAPGTVLAGVIAGSNPWLDGFGTKTVWFGGRRTVGGRCRLKLSVVDSPSPTLRRDGRVVIRCTSPAVLVDGAGAPVLTPDEEAMSDVLGTPVSLERAWRRPTTIGGWSAVAGLPKATDIAVVAGSVFVMRVARGAVTAEGVNDLARRGLGLRRPEGLGCIEVNPPSWSPPPPVTGRVVSARGAPPAVVELRRLLAQGADRRWVAGRLKAAAAAREVGSRPEDALALRRTRPWPPDARAALERALDCTDPLELRTMANALEVEG
ncbi:MAG: hypothetical protein ABIS47_02255 [Acidimicrobiales bacterium]